MSIPYFNWPGSPQNVDAKLVKMAEAADDLGFNGLWVMDHFFDMTVSDGKIVSIPNGPMLEGYSTVSFLAGVTHRIKVGLLVTGNIYRHPGILIKTVTTLDVLSGGRGCFGIGAGWYEREAKGLGVPFPSLRERFERLEETLQIAKHMWSGNTSPFRGRYYQLDEPINSPPPLTKPHPPLMIGMWKAGDRMLKLTAKYGDACNLQIGSSLTIHPPYINERYRIHREFLESKLTKLKEFCRQVGRPYEDIERTVLGTVKFAPETMNPHDVVELCKELAEIGIQHVIFNMPDVHDIKPVEILGHQVIPEIADL